MRRPWTAWQVRKITAPSYGHVCNMQIFRDFLGPKHESIQTTKRRCSCSSASPKPCWRSPEEETSWQILGCCAYVLHIHFLRQIKSWKWLWDRNHLFMDGETELLPLNPTKNNGHGMIPETSIDHFQRILAIFLKMFHRKKP